MSWLEVDLDPLLHMLETSEDPSLLAQASTNIANLSKHEMIREELISKGCVRLLAKAATKIADIDTLRMMPALISDLVDNVPSSTPLLNGDASVLMLVKQRQFEYPTLVLLKEHSSNLEFYKFLGQDEEQTSRFGYNEGVRSALVGSSLYLIGGRDCNDFRFTDNCILFKDSSNPEIGWKKFELPFYSSHMKIVACKDFIYIFPGDEPFFYKGVDDNIYYPEPTCSQYPKNPSYAYRYDTVRKKGCNIELPCFPFGLRVLPPLFDPTDPACDCYKLDNEFWDAFFVGFRVCTAWDSKGILISMLGSEDGNFYFHEPENSRWRLLPTFEPLPKFKGRLPSRGEFPQPIVQFLSAVLNETLYCCDVPDSSDKTSPVLHVYNLRKGRVELSHDLPLLRSLGFHLKMLPLADGELLFLGYCEEWATWKQRIKYIKVKVFKGYAKVVKEMSISLPFDITEVCDYFFINNRQLGIESEDLARGNKVERIEASISVKGEEENKENVRSKLLIERANLAIELLNSANTKISKGMALLKLLDIEAGSSEVGSPYSPRTCSPCSSELGEEFYECCWPEENSSIYCSEI